MKRSTGVPSRLSLRHVCLFPALLLIGVWNIWMSSHMVYPLVKANDTPLRDQFGAKTPTKNNHLQSGQRSPPSRIKQRKLPTDATCVNITCVRVVAKGMARIFPSHAQNQTWRMNPSTSQSDSLPGLVYVKVPKTGSSTVAGAAIRIARAYRVSVRYDHSSPLEQDYLNQRNGPVRSTFLFGSVRDPTERAISYLAYDFSRTQREWIGSTQGLLDALQSMDRLGAVQKSEGRGGSQLALLSLRAIPKHSAWKPTIPSYVMGAGRVKLNVQRVLEDFDFLLVTERMDESLVALAMLLGVSIRDVLVFSSKIAVADSERNEISDPLNYLPIHNKTGGMSCVPLRRIPDAIVKHSKVQAYLESKEWHAMNHGDYLLHEAAKASLDLTISALGKQLFQSALTDYRMLLQFAQRQCVSRIQRPCSSTGTLQLKKASENCYSGDYGCGHHCIDEVCKHWTL